MHTSTLTKNWIAIISLLAMLLSGIASAAPVKAMEMVEQSHQASLSDCGQQVLENNPHAGHHAAAKALEPDCGSESMMNHDCCPATCFSVYAFLSTDFQSPQHHTQLALIDIESKGSAIKRESSLYRPPIA